MNLSRTTSFPIDAVITWVDGSDPILSAKRNSYLTDPKAASDDNIAGSTRYIERGEIHWCVRSINKFMPWIRRIFIVTDGQNPKVKSQIPVEIIDHKVIFRGYEQYLPTFNSLSIEALLWRIPGLSEHFIYLNDDFLICRPVSPNLFFPKEGEVICHGRESSVLCTKIVQFIKHFVLRKGQVNHIKQMMLAANITGNYRTFIHLSHTPYPLIRSVLEQFYTQHSDKLIQNIRNRFRSLEHFRTDELCYMLLRQKGRLHLRPVRPILMRYYSKKGMLRLEYTLHRVTKPNSKICFACFYALEKTEVQVFNRITQFVENLLRDKKEE